MNASNLYLIFCAATSLSFIYEFFWPALSEAIKDGIENEFTKAPKLSIFSMFVVNLVLAPVVFIAIFFPGLSKHIASGIRKAVRE